jgi:hypothetical protein
MNPSKTGFIQTGRKTIKNHCMQEQETVAPAPAKQAGEEKQSGPGWKRLLNYQSIVKQVPFILFLALLAVIYIYNGHYADKLARSIGRTAKEVKELEWEYIDVKKEVMFRSKPSELVKAVEPLGLKELTVSPVVLKDSVTN